MMHKGMLHSMVPRITVSMFAVILLAEVFAGIVWFKATSASKRESASIAVSTITSAAAETINYFADLPVNYRHLILEQLRNIGGTRFFVSMNNSALTMPSLVEHALVPAMEAQAIEQLESQIKHSKSLKVTLTSREEILLFNTGLHLDELPALWKDYSLVLGKLDLPIMVIQVQLPEDKWLYLATVLPLSFNDLKNSVIDGRQITFLLIVTVLLVGVSYVVLSREIRPFRSLARSATLMGANMETEEIKEEGSSETRAAIHAFNKMNRRIKAYLRDRDMFFNAISHDIKTPLACLKLRTEMLEDPPTKARFEKLLNEVELMLNGALQCMRDNDIHEELEWFDLNDFVEQCAAVHNQNQEVVRLHQMPPIRLYGKPLAIKRCLFNLVDNGVKYGQTVDINMYVNQDSIQITLHDAGPGIANDQLEEVFKPYYRIHDDVDGSGLGLYISRSIARSHGGDVTLSNSPDGGLEVDIVLAKIV
ncbi:two-component sensor histidine kinase [Vibrio nigripulchritudo]|uniref:ATP-binding protein n=1 Tax=Vibrio nigripulchritudo TaxID=28173 RepID=UPI00190E4F47|nr:ATP-binding protein [Vibrio nigripulchritudo]BCL71110.1 two-component sensor histidine kinase [Vibrio nigripulchritudo]BDU32466.1 two-component sensor histidine kinase [Vibrio nigripulchritudo]